MTSRRVLYNVDGDSCLFTKANSKGPVALTRADLKTLIDEITFPGSQVESVLVCVNAQVMYYPTQVGTMRGGTSTPDERAQWPPSEQQRFANIARFFADGVDPYAELLRHAQRRGCEALLAFRMNDDHGNDFLRTQFWLDHPEWRLGKGALNFAHAGVRDYVARLIEEALQRYACDGIELDFNRFPNFFPESVPQEARVAAMDSLIERLQAQRKKGRKKRVLGVRVPSNYGRSAPTPESARALGCDVVGWAKRDWVDFVTVSEFLFTATELPLAPWRAALPHTPLYGGIECTAGGKKELYLTPELYRRHAAHLRRAGADGIYLFNFFTTREYGAEAWEPPFAVLRDLVSG